MSLHVHQLDIKRHAKFLAEDRQDPITKEPLKAGDEIVICANCNTAYLRDSWNFINSGKCVCGGTNTLNYVPGSVLELRRSPGKLRLGRTPPLEIPEAALSRFRWQLLPALAVIVATLIYIIGESFVPLAIIFIGIGFALSKPLFRYQSSSGKNLIISAWTVAGLLLLAIIVAKSVTPPQESSRLQFTVTAPKNVNAKVRTDPSGAADSLGVLKIQKGETLGILEVQGDWYKIKVIVNGKDKVGWIHKDLVVQKAPVFNISGEWEGVWEVEGLFNPLAKNKADFKLSLKQNGSNLTGTYYERGGSTNVTGKIEGDEISFEYRYKDGGSRKYTGNISNKGDMVSGKWIQEGWSGTWKMVRKDFNLLGTPQEKSTSASAPYGYNMEDGRLAPIPAPTAPAKPGQKTAPPAEVTSFTITIRSTPSEAAVRIDKELRGTTPLSIVLGKGSHGISIEKEGYKTKWDIIDVSNDNKKEFYFSLDKE